MGTTYNLGLNLVGQRAGNLVVIRKTDKRRHRHIVWECLCDCGKTTEVVSSHLSTRCKNGPQTKSCGCLLKNNGPKSGDPAIVAFNLQKHSYVYAAKRRGFTWELSDEDFLDLIVQPCIYCGQEPTPRHYNKKVTTFKSNGVDRKDNKIGYIVDNCVPCCATCNRAKMDMSVNEFMEWISRVEEYYDI
mgnify:CR=1 FL=1